MKLEDFCAGVYGYYPKLTSQNKFIVALFVVAGDGYVSKSYAKKLFIGAKGFVIKQKFFNSYPFRNNAQPLTTYFMMQQKRIGTGGNNFGCSNFFSKPPKKQRNVSGS